jgi:hypothetical protein
MPTYLLIHHSKVPSEARMRTGSSANVIQFRYWQFACREANADSRVDSNAGVDTCVDEQHGIADETRSKMNDDANRGSRKLAQAQALAYLSSRRSLVDQLGEKPTSIRLWKLN